MTIYQSWIKFTIKRCISLSETNKTKKQSIKAARNEKDLKELKRTEKDCEGLKRTKKDKPLTKYSQFQQ